MGPVEYFFIIHHIFLIFHYPLSTFNFHFLLSSIHHNYKCNIDYPLSVINEIIFLKYCAYRPNKRRRQITNINGRTQNRKPVLCGGGERRSADSRRQSDDGRGRRRRWWGNGICGGVVHQQNMKMIVITEDQKRCRVTTYQRVAEGCVLTATLSHLRTQ